MNVTPLSFRRKLALELDRRLQNQINHDHPLREVFWECTLRCNLHCRHSGSDCKQVAGYRECRYRTSLACWTASAASATRTKCSLSSPAANR